MRVNIRPFLKWPGGKYRLLPRIRKALQPGKRLVEPFVGSGAVFLNTDYDTYLLADANPDLIGLYRQLLEEGPSFIRYCRRFFDGRHNNGENYYAYRDEFNETRNARRKSALFLYLNRHGYNGLCRYNGKGGFNTPFGRYDKPYFPEKEMQAFAARAQSTTLLQAHFHESMAKGAARRCSLLRSAVCPLIGHRALYRLPHGRFYLGRPGTAGRHRLRTGAQPDPGCHLKPRYQADTRVI